MQLKVCRPLHCPCSPSPGILNIVSGLVRDPRFSLGSGVDSLNFQQTRALQLEPSPDPKAEAPTRDEDSLRHHRPRPSASEGGTPKVAAFFIGLVASELTLCSPLWLFGLRAAAWQVTGRIRRG